MCGSTSVTPTPGRRRGVQGSKFHTSLFSNRSNLYKKGPNESHNWCAHRTVLCESFVTHTPHSSAPGGWNGSQGCVHREMGGVLRYRGRCRTTVSHTCVCVRSFCRDVLLHFQTRVRSPHPTVAVTCMGVVVRVNACMIHSFTVTFAPQYISTLTHEHRGSLVWLWGVLLLLGFNTIARSKAAHMLNTLAPHAHGGEGFTTTHTRTHTPHNTGMRTSHTVGCISSHTREDASAQTHMCVHEEREGLMHAASDSAIHTHTHIQSEAEASRTLYLRLRALQEERREVKQRRPSIPSFDALYASAATREAKEAAGEQGGGGSLSGDGELTF